MFKKISFIHILLIAFSAAFAEDGGNSNAFNKYMSPEGGINPMSGTVALSKSLANISVGEVSVNFDLSYSGNVFKEVQTRNDQTTVGLVGLGWSLGRAKVVSDNRGTSFIGDDQYYLMLASGGRFKIFKNNPSNPNEKWWVEGNPFMKVEQVIGSTDVTGKGDYITYVKGWKITDTKGVVHEYGDITEPDNKILTNPQRNATEYDLFWPLDDKGELGYGLIGKAISGDPWLYPTVWNVSKETDVEGNYLVYTYEQITEGLSGNFNVSGPWNSKGKEYTKESYLTKVVSSMNDELQFEYGNKGEGEFFGEFVDYEGKRNELLGDKKNDMSIEKVERKYLSKIVISGRNGKIGTVELCYTPLFQYTNGGVNGVKKEGFVKRLLSAVRFFNKKGEESDYEYYKYYDGSEQAVSLGSQVAYPLGALYSVKGKDCGWVEYSYGYESLGRGHMETVSANKIYGKGYLEDGTSYLVGKKADDKTVVVFHRINGGWKEIKNFSVREISDIELGDQGWFLVKEKRPNDKVRALVYQWDGKDWVQAFEEVVDNSNDFWSTSSKAMNVFAGPDYVLRVITEKSGFFSNPKTEIRAVWSKWGKQFDVDNDIGKAMVNEGGVRIMAQKNHILVQVNTTDFSNAVKFFVYTFDTKGGVKETFSEKDQDNGSMYFLDNDYFVGVEEPSAYIGGDSRFRSWVWTGSGWVREYKDVFDNDGAYTAMDLQAHGQDYYTVRHHSKRYLTNYYWDGEKWSTKAGEKQRHFQVQDYAWFSAAWKWAGFSGRDFFIAGESRLKCKWWGCDVKKYVYLHHYYMKDAKNKKWSYDYIGSKGEKMNQKEVITGKDWFVEKNQVKIAWIWDGEKWIEESLWGKVSNLQDAYSLGEDAFAVSSGNQTNIYYKVGNSFFGSYDSYRVKTKTIFEPVVDKTIEYTYGFTPKNTSIAYDEANNTPLFKEMSVTLPSGQGTKHSVLCDGEYTGSDGKTEYNVGLGATCLETQEGRANSNGKGHTALMSRKKTFYERHRESGWPTRVYQDRITKEVSFNGLTKETTTYGYSSKNGQVISTKKKNGNKTTEEVVKYVADLNSPLSNYEAVLGKYNRIDAVAGGYSCIGECSSGRVISAYANGWGTKENIFRSVSTWNMAPQKRMTKNDVENDVSYIVKNGSASTRANWKRSSYNSEYNDGDVIETEEGPKKVKMASFKNPVSRRVYGTAAGCGVNEGLMLSGEYCGPVNNVTWSGCVQNDALDDIKGYAVNANNGEKYGRFSAKLLKLSASGALSATITKPVTKKYRISAWVQTLDNDSVKVRVSLGSHAQEKNVKTNKGWQRVEFETPALQSNASVQFSMTTSAPSGIRLQDIRVLPYDASSSALFWDDVWDKVLTTVNDRGVGSYVAYDNMGRETETYSETDAGNVYLSSRKTFVDGSCVITASGANALKSVKVNGRTYSNPSSKRSFTLDAVDVDVELGLEQAGTEVRYSLVVGSEADWKNRNLDEWNPVACGGLCPISIKFSTSPEWTLFVDVAPFNTAADSKGDYAFQFGMKKKDWVVYGQVDGFADGMVPQFMNPKDSASIVYMNDDDETIYKAEFGQGKWTNSSSPVIDGRAVAYSFASGTVNGKSSYYLSLIPVVSNADESTVLLAYPKTYGSENGGGYIYKDLKDDSFSTDNLKVTIGQNSAALLFRADIREKNVAFTFKDSTDPNRTYQRTIPRLVPDDNLYSKIWNEQSKQWNNLGSTPVFDKDTLSVSFVGNDTILKVVHGNLVSYLDGVVCDYNSKSFDMVSGPDGKFYVAYIGNVKNFEVSKSVAEDDGTVATAKLGPAYIVVKRLYDASETSLGKSVWAGPSKISGQPRYEGDIISWDGSNLHAIDEAQSVKLAYDGQSLFMAVVYKTHPDERFEDDEDGDGSTNANVDYGELALTVFKASVEQNVSADGVVYSSYLRWIPVKDNSIAVAKNGNALADERNRVLYMQPDDIFDLKVRGDTPYILFGNKANGNRVTVLTHDGNRWLSIGNPAFAYPTQSEKSVDLAVNVKQGVAHPYVVFKQGLDRGYATRRDRLVSMRYNADDKIDLSISAMDLGADSLDESCAFRQYILNYALNAGYESALSIKPTLRTPSDVARIEIYVNDTLVTTRTATSTAFTSVALAENLNRVELRVVGKDSSDLSYTFNTYRKPRPNPDFWGTGNSSVVSGSMFGTDTLKVDVTPIVPNRGDSTGSSSRTDTTKIQIHVTGGWELHVVDSLTMKDTVLYGGDTLRIVGDSLPKVIAVSPDSDTVFVDIFVRPDTLRLFRSSSSVNPGSSSSRGWDFSYSSGDGDDDIYTGNTSSSSYYPYYSSSSCGYCGSSSSSYDPYGGSSSSGEPGSSSSGNGSSSSGETLSGNVPDEVRVVADAKYHTVGNIRLGNLVTVEGSIFAGNGIEVGVESQVSDQIVSGGNVSLANRSHVSNVRLGGNFQAQGEAVYGEVVYASDIQNASMPVIPFATGSSDILVEVGQSQNAVPGAYRGFTARESSVIHFAAGDYYFDSFWTDPRVELEFEAGTRIWVTNGFNVGNFNRITHGGSLGDLFIYVGSYSYIPIGNNVQMRAVVYAPHASVQLFDHSVFEGYMWSANFNVEPYSVLR
ncbi:hypothetical protein [Fibrobacter succinogenes]|uniref:hypothetical protein n=1 Tax=Fibrobacter succinogenes TaxID=833 RepID=UPI001568DD46|nr:hypothetical protein [Fibrobacter succinogenes]